MNDQNNNKPAKVISPSHLNQILVLKCMNLKEPGTAELRTFQIDEIAESSGLKDEKETQRYLFILEGQKLVTPQPEGDFTSKNWVITRNGVKALKTIEKAMTF